MVADCITNNSTRNVVTWLANQNSSNSNLKDQQSIFSFRNFNSSTSQNLLAAIAASNFVGIYNNSEKEEPVKAKETLLLLNCKNCSPKSTEKTCSDSKYTSNQLTETTFENNQVFNSPNSLQHSKSKIAFLTSKKQNNLTEVIVSAATEAIKIANTTLSTSSSLSSSSTSSVESQHNISKTITEKSDIMLVSQHATESPLMSGVPRWIDCINDSNPNHQFKSRQQQHLQNQQQQHLQNQQQQQLQNQQQQQLQNQQPLQNQQQQTNHRSSLHNQYASNLNFNYKKKFHMPSNSTTNHSILSNASIGNTSRSLVYSKSNSTNVNTNMIVSTESAAPVTANAAEYMSASSLENNSQTEYNNIWNDFGRGDQSCSSHFYFASENETSILAQQSHAPNPPNSSNFHSRNWNEEYSLLSRKHMEKPLTSSVSAAAASASTRLPFSSVTSASNVSVKKNNTLTHNYTWDRKPSQLLQPPQNVQTSPAIPLLPLNIVPIRYKTQNGPQIMNVWNHNLEEEFAKIRDIVEHFQYVAIDTEFPGIVVLPAEQTLDYHYQTIKLNVDLLKIIQLGITFADEHGCTPPGTSTWQFNFKFNINQDMYAEDSIGVLKASGIDFATCERDGIDIHEFGEIIMSSGLVMSKNVKWISFHGSYDFGYLLKLLTCSLLPESETQFFELLNDFFPALYDIKYLLQNCSQLNSRISLQKIAEHLEVERVGQQHQAGSDSLLTCQTFFRLMNKYFNNLLDDSIYSGVIYGLGKAVNSDTDFLHYRSARCPPYDKQNKNSNHFSLPNPAVVPFKTMPATKNPHMISSKPYFS